jgi:hypothetical protein
MLLDSLWIGIAVAEIAGLTDRQVSNMSPEIVKVE